MNARVSSDNALVRREIDKLMAEAYDLRKEVDYQQARNIDISGQIRDLEIRVKDKDDQIYGARRDLDAQKFSN